MENIQPSDDLVVWEEVQGRDWVIFYGNERYFIDLKTKEAILDGIKRKLAIIVVDGIVWTDKFSRIMPKEMVKEADYLKKGFKRSKQHENMWYDPRISPIQYFD